MFVIKIVLVLLAFNGLQSLPIDSQISEKSLEKLMTKLESTNDGKTWFVSKKTFTGGIVNAISSCAVFGMSLVMLETRAEMENLLEFYKLDYPAFVGITDEGSEGKWYNLRSGVELPFELKFHSGEPNNAANGENCLELSFKDNKTAFNDVPCNSEDKNFICEKVEGTTGSFYSKNFTPRMFDGYLMISLLILMQMMLQMTY